jgi:hypothetical protein
MALGPVVSSPGLTEHKVVRPENLSVRSGTDRVHRTGLEVDEDGPRHVLVGRGLVVVDLKLVTIF